MTAIAASAQTTTGKPGVEIQGNFNAGYQMNSWKGVSVKGLDQNGSGTTQINIRGLEDLGGGMAAYFRVENDLSIMNNAANQGVLPTFANSTAVTSGSANTSPLYRTTTGAASSWGNGELAVGLRSPMGDFAFGALNNAGLVYSQLTAAPTQGTSFASGYGTVLGADPTLSVVRWANSFRYITPNMNGFEASFIYAAKQDSGTPTVKANGVAATTTSLGVGLNNQVGAKELGLKYAQGPLTLAAVTSRTSLSNFCAASTLTASQNQAADGSNNTPCYGATIYSAGTVASPIAAVDASQDNKQNSLAAKYDLGNGWLVSGAMQKTTLGKLGAASTSDFSDRSATFLNAQYTTGKHTVFVSNGSVKEQASANTKNGKKSTFTGMGYNYALSKTTSLVARYEQFDDQANVLGTVLGSPNAYSQMTAASTTDLKRVRSMLGLNVNF